VFQPPEGEECGMNQLCTHYTDEGCLIRMHRMPTRESRHPATNRNMDDATKKAERKEKMKAEAAALGISYLDHKANLKAKKAEKKRKRPEETEPEPTPTPEEPTPEPEEKFVPLADRLNKNRTGYDPVFAAHYKSLSKPERSAIAQEDFAKITAIKKRTKSLSHNFTVDEADHCETSPTAYKDIEASLASLAASLGKPISELRIYDPYYCAGAATRHLASLGFSSVYNKNEDFYKAITDNAVPPHDVVVTNPPYSGDHVERLVRFVKEQPTTPFFVLVPDYFQDRAYWKELMPRTDTTVIKPATGKYVYWTPDSLRPMTGRRKKEHKNLALGVRTAPFATSWYLSK